LICNDRILFQNKRAWIPALQTNDSLILLLFRPMNLFSVMQVWQEKLKRRRGPLRPMGFAVALLLLRLSAARAECPSWCGGQNCGNNQHHNIKMHIWRCYLFCGENIVSYKKLIS
jgi:hypothetical protein